MIESGSWDRRNSDKNATEALDVGMLLAEGKNLNRWDIQSYLYGVEALLSSLSIACSGTFAMPSALLTLHPQLKSSYHIRTFLLNLSTLIRGLQH